MMAAAQETVDVHIAALLKTCRICGSFIASKKNVSKIAKYTKEISGIYRIDVSKDEAHIHPPSFCNKCRLSVTRANTSLQSGKKFEGHLPNLATFKSHEPSCPICLRYNVHVRSIQPDIKEPTVELPSTSHQATSSTSSSTQGPTIGSSSRVLFSDSVPDPGNREHGRKRVWSARASLKDVARDYARSRTKVADTFITDYCVRHRENKADLLYFLLTEDLRSSNDHRLKEVLSSWGDDLTVQLSADDCLAMRVTTLTSKRKYKEQYRLLKSKGNDYLKPPHILDELEKSYMPGSVRFQLEGGADLIHHTPVKAGAAHIEYGNMSLEPAIIGDGGLHEELELPVPNFKGVEWPYPHAIAKTLEELDEHIESGLKKHGLDPKEDHLIITTVKDGADGMGDISIIKEASAKLLPDKAFRAAFAIIKCEVQLEDGGKAVIYEPDDPNSITITRPILEAIADENHVACGVTMLDCIEHSRKVMEDAEMRVHANGWWRRHRLIFFNSMIDEKLDRSQGGLQGSGSKFLCTLCHATRETARSHVGTFKITRTLEENVDMASYVQTNPDDLSQSDLASVAKGVKDYPILKSEPHHKLLDATHADINLGSFFKKLIICEVARTYTWEISRDVKLMFEDGEKRFNDHIRATLGLAPNLMMPGNYARQLFDPENMSSIVGIIPDDERRNHLRDVMVLFTKLRSVYRAHHPRPADVAAYKTNAIQMADLLLRHFAYAAWPNYLHKVIEHVQEVLQDPLGPGTIGALSGEGNEAANKLFRDLRRNFSRKNNTLASLRDIIWIHWLYTSPKLRHLVKVSSRSYKCSNCHESGHNVLACPTK